MDSDLLHSSYLMSFLQRLRSESVLQILFLNNSRVLHLTGSASKLQTLSLRVAERVEKYVLR